MTDMKVTDHENV